MTCVEIVDQFRRDWAVAMENMVIKLIARLIDKYDVATGKIEGKKL